jgi:hypothetical protein
MAFGPITREQHDVSDTKIIELFEQWMSADEMIAAWTQFEDEQAEAKFDALCDHADDSFMRSPISQRPARLGSPSRPICTVQGVSRLSSNAQSSRMPFASCRRSRGWSVSRKVHVLD